MTMVVERSRNASFQYNPNPEDVTSPSDPKHDRELSSIVNLVSTLGLRHSPHGTTETETNEPQKQSSIGQFPSTEKQKCQCVGSLVACCSGLTERVILTILVLGRMLEGKLVAESLAASFLAHAVLIGLTPLPKRRLRPSSQHDYEKSSMNIFLADFARLSDALLSENAWTEWMSTNNVVCDISDLVDGRLCEAVFADPIIYTLDTQQISTFVKFAHALCAVSGFHLKPLSSAPATKMSYQSINGSIANDLTILPFTNPVFDKHLISINIRTAPLKASERQSGRIYQEVTHWHNARRRLDPKATLQTPATEKEKKRGLRRNQFFMAEMQAYAASLTNAAGKALEPEILTVSGSTYPESLKDTKAAKPAADKAQKTKATPNRKKAMLEDIAANKAIKDNQTDEKIFSAWRTVRKNLDAERSLQSKYLKIQAYLRDLSEAKRSVLQCEVELHLLCILVEMYSILRKESESKPAASLREEIFGIAALIWDTSRRLASMGGLTKTIARMLEDIVKMLGLPDPRIPRVQNERKLAYDPALLLPRGSELVIHLGSIEFQLLHCGPYMDRNLDSAPDSRVPFHPDAWQRRVLDELDAKNSVFVVAPTSAGKTFISFYAMEKILRADDDSVLVYVAPTKALVNQIAAEIQARFRKTYKFAGKSVWAIHTRDYRINNPSGCQILVTVPHILQIMLLAPSNAKSWSPRVKYIIFDEIHSIGQAEDGIVWEQLLLLAPCPIIALSATVGNPEMFNSWLSSTQQSSGREVTMIKHQHRYSDLRKFVFNPPKRFAFFGLADRPSFATLGLGGLEGLAFVHPIASLVNKSRGMPDDLSLEARDCLSLYQAMKKHETPEFSVDATLSPSNYDVLPGVIRKAHIIEWEQKLKTLLKKWMASEQSPFDKVLEDLSQSIEVSSSPDKQVSKGEIAEVEDDEFVDVDAGDLYATTLPLLCKLHERNALPTILFNYDRQRCEGIALNLLKQLEGAESRWKNTSPAWKAKLQNFEDYKKNQAKAGAKKPVKAVAKKKGKEDDDDGGSRMDRIQDAASEEANPYANFDPAAPVDGFHFAAKQKAQASELSEYFYQMTRRGVSPWLTLALRRGIGVHHAGMNRKYRQVVEMLFRKGYLRVVIATGTLALGINMPCATVVFSGDSIFLTALNFRQAAGRAGRRGFDLLGNVVFQNISHGKICRLLSSRLPDLNGHFPVTTTLVLRLFSLLNESGDSPYAVKAINSLLSQPRLYLDGPAFKDQVLHHLRFSIEYLRRQDLLSAQGTPINFAGLTSHLYFTENSSFALNALIKGEYFHQLCSQIDTKESHVLRTLMIVMAHLFGRRPCREVTFSLLFVVYITC
jgi:superfamily II RNA helicase